MKLLLAGLTFDLDLDDASRAVLAARLEPYVGGEGHDVRCRIRSLPGFVQQLELQPPAVEVTLTGTSYRFERRDFRARLDIDSWELEVEGAPSLGLEAPLRIALALALPRRGGLLLHSSGIVEKGEAYVFSGPSGAGKTTTVRLLRPRPTLGDDLVALIQAGGRFAAHALPFAGEYGVVPPASAPLAHLYFLEQASEHAAHSLAEDEARRRILRNTLAHARDLSTVGLLQDVAAKIAARVACARLRFRRDQGIVQALGWT